MMRRSGSRPAVKRWKLCCEMLRRAASGHIEATQLSKFAAASRIALAVISGWPEAPSSPLHGKGAPLAAGTPCAEVPGGWAHGADWPPFDPVKFLSRNLGAPLMPHCPRPPPLSNSAAVRMRAPLRLLANSPVRCVMFHPSELSPFQEALSRLPMD